MEGDEEPVRWERESWEAKMKEFAMRAGGKSVVPMTPGSLYPLFVVYFI